MKLLILSIISGSLAVSRNSGTTAAPSHLHTRSLATNSHHQSASLGLSPNATGIPVSAADLLAHLSMELPEQQAQWLRQIITDFTPELRSRFLRFITDLTEVPAGGFGAIGTISVRQETRTAWNGAPLLYSYTFSRTLYIPPYDSLEQMRDILTNVILFAFDISAF